MIDPVVWRFALEDIERIVLELHLCPDYSRAASRSSLLGLGFDKERVVDAYIAACAVTNNMQQFVEMMLDSALARGTLQRVARMSDDELALALMSSPQIQGYAERWYPERRIRASVVRYARTYLDTIMRRV